MTALIKDFIERNIHILEAEDWDNLYDEANIHLFNAAIRELTKVLTEGIGINMEKFAKDNLIKQFVTNLSEFEKDNGIGNISLSDFISYYMPSVNGIDLDEFQLMAEEYLKGDKKYQVRHDSQGQLYIFKVRKI